MPDEEPNEELLDVIIVNDKPYRVVLNNKDTAEMDALAAKAGMAPDVWREKIVREAYERLSGGEA